MQAAYDTEYTVLGGGMDSRGTVAGYDWQATLNAFMKISKDGRSVSEKGNYRNLQARGDRQIYRCLCATVEGLWKFACRCDCFYQRKLVTTLALFFEQLTALLASLRDVAVLRAPASRTLSASIQSMLLTLERRMCMVTRFVSFQNSPALYSDSLFQTVLTYFLETVHDVEGTARSTEGI